jgi:hypothetical protein
MTSEVDIVLSNNILTDGVLITVERLTCVLEEPCLTIECLSRGCCESCCYPQIEFPSSILEWTAAAALNGLLAQISIFEA